MMSYSDAIRLRSITVKKLSAWPDAYPFTVPVIKNLTGIEFTSQVTFLVGENG